MCSITATDPVSLREAAVKRVVIISGYLRWITGLLITFALITLIVISAWCIWSPTGPDDSGIIETLGMSDGDWKIDLTRLEVEFSVRAKVLIVSYFTLMVLYVVYCLTRIYGLFANFQKTKIFIKHNSKILRNLGYVLIAGIILQWLLEAAFLVGIGILDASTLLDLNLNFSIQLSPTEFLMKLLTIGSIFLSAWIIDIGRELFLENELTI